MGKACAATEHRRTGFDHFDGYVICIDGIDGIDCVCSVPCHLLMFGARQCLLYLHVIVMFVVALWMARVCLVCLFVCALEQPVCLYHPFPVDLENCPCRFFLFYI